MKITLEMKASDSAFFCIVHKDEKCINYLQPKIIKDPTGNCQICSICDFQRLHYVRDKDSLDYLISLYRLSTLVHYSKPIMLLDLRRDSRLLESFDFIFKGSISKKNYVSTNSSEMVIYLLEREKIRISILNKIKKLEKLHKKHGIEIILK